MVKVIEKGIPGKSIGATQQVLSDPGIAAANNERRIKALKALQSTSNSFFERRRQAAEENFLFENVNAAEREYAAMYEQLQNENMNNPEGVSDAMLEHIRRDMETRLGNASNDETKNRLSQKLETMATHYSTHAMKWENNRSTEIYAGNFDNHQRDRLEAIMNSDGDLALTERLMQDQKDEIEAAKAYLPIEKVLKYEDEFKADMYGAAIEARIAGNAGRALSELNQGKWNGKLSNVQKAAAVSKAKSRYQQQTAHLRAAIMEKAEAAIARAELHGDASGHALIAQVENVAGAEAGRKFATELAYSLESREDKMAFMRATSGLQVAEMRESLHKIARDPNSTMHDIRRAANADKIAETVIKLRRDDPHALARLSAEGKLDSTDAVIRQQRLLGVDENNLMPISREEAKMVVERLNGDLSPSRIKREVMALHAKFPAEQYPLLVRQLKREGAGTGLFLTAAMHPLDDAMAQTLSAEVTTLSETQIKEAGSLDNDVVKGVKSNITEKMKDYFSTMIQKGVPIEDVQGTVDHMHKMGLAYKSRGATDEEAANMATGWVLDKVSEVDIGDQTLHIPKAVQMKGTDEALDISPSVVRRMAEQKAEDIVAGKIEIIPFMDNGQPFPQEYMGEEIRFVNADDDSGLELRFGVGLSPIVDKDGNRIKVDYVTSHHEYVKHKERTKKAIEDAEPSEEEKIMMMRGF